MSAMTTGSTARAPRPLVPPVPAARTRALRLVPARRSSAARAPFVLVVVVLLVSGLLGLLMLNTMVAQDSFRLHDLTVQGKSLDDREEVLNRQVQALQAPTSLAQRATAMGMVPGGAPLFLRLADGAVLGAAAQAAPVRPVPAAPVRPVPTATVRPVPAAPIAPVRPVPAAPTAPAAPVTPAAGATPAARAGAAPGPPRHRGATRAGTARPTAVAHR